MIEEVANQAINDISNYYQAQDRRQSKQHFESSLAKLSQQVDNLKVTMELYQVMKAENLKPPALISSIDKDNLLEVLEDCSEKISNYYLEDHIIMRIEREVKTLREKQKNDWHWVISEYAANVVNSLNIMSSLLDDPEAARGLENSIRDLQSKWPIQPTDVYYFTEKVAEAKIILDALPVEEESISEFIKKLRMEQATISDLNNDVLSWIRQNNLEERIKLLFAS